MSEHPFGLHLTHLPRKGHPASCKRHGSHTEALCKPSQPDRCWIRAGPTHDRIETRQASR